jgi:hypothetical protein
MKVLRKSYVYESAGFRTVVLLTLLISLASCGGCSRGTIEGTVTLDGQPLAEGYVNFRPEPGTHGSGAGTPVENGEFVIEGLAEPLAGSYRVEITATGKTGTMTVDGSGQRREAEGQILPDRYNTQSTLQAEVKPGQPNEFTFKLTSE